MRRLYKLVLKNVHLVAIQPDHILADRAKHHLATMAWLLDPGLVTGQHMGKNQRRLEVLLTIRTAIDSEHCE